MMTAEPELISQAELARRLGVSRQYVNRLVRSGKLELEGKKIDAAKAVAALRQVRDPARKYKTDEPADLDQPAPQPEPAAKRQPTFAEAKTMKEVYLARMARLKYEEEAGKLVPKADVEARAADIGMVVKQNILSIPSRLMDQLADETDPREINAILEAELRRALEQLAQELRRG
jgi:transcriptional regulator with XRE-family HTH domain